MDALHQLAKRGPVLDSNLGPIISIISWILIACSVLSVGIKLFLWALATRRFLPEDIAIVVSLVLSIGYTSAISWASEHGLGMYDATIAPRQRQHVQAAIYASDILFVPTVASTQISIMFFLYQVTPYQRHRVILKAIGIFVILFTIPSFFAVCFQCSGPAYSQLLDSTCFNQEAFWTAYGVISVVLEIGFVALPAWIVSHVQIPFRRKLTIIICFAFRLSVAAAWIVALVLRHAVSRGSNFLHDAWGYYLCLVIIQAVAVITQCIPYIRNLLAGVESGMIRTGQFRLRATPRATPKGTDISSGRQGSLKRKPSIAIELQNFGNGNGRKRSETADPLSPNGADFGHAV